MELDVKTMLLAIICLIVLLVMQIVPTPTITEQPTFITVTGSVTVPEGMVPTGTTIQLFNESEFLVGQAVVGESGAFRFESSSRKAGTYKIIATKGSATGIIYVGLGYGDNNIGTIALERV